MMLFKGGDEGPKQNLKFTAFYGEKYSAMTSNWLRVSERGRIWLQAALALGFLLTHLSTGSRDPAPTLSLYKERFRTIEPMFAWEDKLRRLLLRFECIRGVHYAFKALACTMINLQHYCQI
jgi:hypothetical protein